MIRPSLTEGRFVGTPTNLRLIRVQDLPADRDMRQWYFRYCRFGGRNLSQYDMRDCDILDSNLIGCTLPDMDWVVMRRCNVQGVTFAGNVPSWNHDLISEIVRTAPNATDPAVVLVRNYITQNYANSWRDGIQKLRTDLGLTYDQMRTTFVQTFAGHPKILRQLAEGLQRGGDTRKPGEGVDATTPIRILTPSGERNVQFTAELNATDRWAVARAIENRVMSNFGEEVVAHVHQLDPWPAAIIVHKDRFASAPEFGWWAGDWA